MGKNRTRQELRLKFKKEERLNNKMIDRCLKEKGMFAELDSLLQDTDDEDDDDPDDDFGRARSRKPKKKRSRKRYRNRGYYASSSDGEEADVEASKSPVRKMPKQAETEKTPRPPVVQGVTQVSVSAPSVGNISNISIHHSQPGVQFPPGLLAANPSLAGAKPGSLVVVASPHRPDNALLSVYMVPDKSTETVQPQIMSPRSNTLGTGLPELKLDPAVIRAVDRGKLGRQRTMSESMMKVGRKRTYSEMKESPDDSENIVAAKIHRRQRTCSESGIQTRQQQGRSDLVDRLDINSARK